MVTKAKHFFQKMIRCPYSLSMTKPEMIKENNQMIYRCTVCKSEIHRDFVEKPNIPRSMIGIVGFSGHGKTVYIASLFYLLQFFKTKWENYYFLSMDDNTHKIIYRDIPQMEEKSILPDSTPANFPLPSLIYFQNIPYYGKRFLSIYDTAGEVFEDTKTLTDKGRFVAHADTVIFIVSIHDLGYQWPSRMQELLEIYLRAVYDRMHVNLKKKQHLIVAISKADTLINATRDKILNSATSLYLSDGSYENYAELGEGKINDLKTKSRVIKEWLSGKGCDGFINAARDNFMSVEYTMVSSTGAAPVGNQLATRLNPEDPKMVLDPFLWVLEKNHPRGLSRFLGRFNR